MSLAIDEAAIHALLWLERTGNDTVRVNQVDFADRLMVSKFTVNRLLKRMSDSGRLRCLTRGGGNGPKTYQVTDPVEWSSSPRVEDSRVEGP